MPSAANSSSPPIDEKLATSPTLYSPTASSTFDAEAVQIKRPPTWAYRVFGIGDAPNVTAEDYEQNKREMEQAIAETNTRSLESCPEGYPRVACFLSSESSFSLYRSFNYLHSRVLLNLQDQVAKLEAELDKLDRADERDGNITNLNQRRYDEKYPRPQGHGYRPRKDILADIQQKLVEYDDMLMKARDVQTFQKPSNRDYTSVRSWFWDNQNSIGNASEAAFIKKREDIISLRSGREWSGFDGWVEDSLRRLDCRLVRWLFCTRELRDKTTNRRTRYYSSSRVEKFVGLIITSIIFVLLVLPVVAMYRLTSESAKSTGPHNGTFQAIGVLVVFTLLFSAAMSLLTKARRHELFAAAAAYCAVLVVFIGNFSGSEQGA